MKTRILLSLAMVVLAVVCGCAEKVKVAEQSKTPDAGTLIDKVDALAVKGLAADARGKVIVVNFWAAWCPPCVAEIPEFIRFYNETSREEVALLSLCADDPGTIEEAVRPFAGLAGIPFPVHVLNQFTERGKVDVAAFGEAVRSDFSGALPTTVILDREGRPHQAWVGPADFARLEAETKPLLAERSK